MNSGWRHEGLIPPSREHHYGLMVCLRIHRGFETHETNLDWLRERAQKVIRFFETDLRAHFEAEEEIVFPAMSGIEEVNATIAQLIGEHPGLATFVDRLRLHCFASLPMFSKLTSGRKNVSCFPVTRSTSPQKRSAR